MEEVVSLASESCDEDHESAWVGDSRRIPRLVLGVPLMPDLPPSTEVQPSGAHVIMGGLGGIGLRVAGLLLDLNAARVTIVSRSGRVARSGQGSEQVSTALLSFNAYYH